MLLFDGGYHPVILRLVADTASVIDKLSMDDQLNIDRLNLKTECTESRRNKLFRDK